MARNSKNLKAAYAAIDRNKAYGLAEAVALVKGNAKAKFDETIEIAMNLGVDPRHADQMVRGVVAMPNGTGKTMRVAVFAKDAKADEAKAAGADLVGAEDLAEAIQNGESGFDRVIATPDLMGVVGRQMVRGVIAMPNGTGKTMRVAVFAKDAKADEAKAAGADLVGAEDLAESIQNGESGFDRVIATPDMMGVVGRLGKVLGPRGLMPNPKLGTVTADVTAAVNAAKAGEVQYRAEKAGVVHAGIGKASFDEAKIVENATAFIDAVRKARPSGAKGQYVKKITMSSTMSAGVFVEDAAIE